MSSRFRSGLFSESSGEFIEAGDTSLESLKLIAHKFQPLVQLTDTLDGRKLLDDVCTRLVKITANLGVLDNHFIDTHNEGVKVALQGSVLTL